MCSLQVAANHGLAVYVARKSPTVPKAQKKIIDDAVAKGVIPLVEDSPKAFLDFQRGATPAVLDSFIEQNDVGNFFADQVVLVKGSRANGLEKIVEELGD